MQTVQMRASELVSQLQTVLQGDGAKVYLFQPAVVHVEIVQLLFFCDPLQSLDRI